MSHIKRHRRYALIAALSVIDLLRSRGAKVVYHDPFVPEVHFDHAYTIGDAEPLQIRH